MRKLICTVAAALAFPALVGGIMTGCNTKAVSATNVDTVYVSEISAHKHEVELGRDPSIVALPATLDDCPPGVDCGPGERRKSSKMHTEFFGKFDNLAETVAAIRAEIVLMRQRSVRTSDQTEETEEQQSPIKSTQRTRFRTLPHKHDGASYFISWQRLPLSRKG